MSDEPSVSLPSDVQRFRSLDWYRAFTLVERQALMHDSMPPPGEGHVARALAGQASQAIHRWRAEYPFSTDSPFAERLAAVSISESEFGTLLSLSVEELGRNVQGRPPWLEELFEAFSRPNPKLDNGGRQVNFLRAVEPLLNLFRSRLHKEVLKISRGLEKAPFNPLTVESLFFRNLSRRLLWMLSRTLVLELNVARLSGSLDGNTAEARFESFIESLGQGETAIAILQEYPVLARQLVVCADQWLDNSVEFLTHLSTDFGAICSAFAPGHNPGVLTEVRSDAGDRHRNGRAVIIAKFSSGFTLVYKPRSLAADVHFNEMLTWVNDKGFRPKYRRLRVLDRGSYGWVEFVEAKGCSSPEEIRRFYRRQGGNLALLYALGATDFHHENLIAAGEYPVLVDLEALFSPRLSPPESVQAHQLTADAIMNSVLGTGLLPQGTAEAPDFSGLGTVEGRLSPVGVPHWEQVATDEMRYLRRPMLMHGGANRPTLAGVPVELLDQADSIADGFRDMYRLLREHRQQLLSADGPLAAFADDEVRVVLRPTRTYGHLLEESFHPDVLRDAVDRDYLLDQLWVPVAQYPFLAKVTTAEQKALQQCDIPMFTTRPDSRDLWTCSGECIPEFLYESGLAGSSQRVRELSEDHLERQLWFIRASLTTQAVGRRIRVSASHSTERVYGARREELLRAALTIGDRLEVLAVRGNNSATWIGLKSTGKNQWSLAPLGADLYDGLPGMALFLAYLGSVTGQERFTSLAQGALTTLYQLAAQENPSMLSIGGFSGSGGVIYALTSMGVLWNDANLIAKAEDIVKTLPDLIDQDKQLDIIGGAAGCILSLLGLYRVSRSESTLDAAIRCGELIVERAIRQEIGAAWGNANFGRRPLAGFSHGTAGIAYALTELAAHAQRERYCAVALDAIAYERSLFDAKMGNWPDLREMDVSNHAGEAVGESFPVAWCHGAAGIGLARLNMLSHFDDAEIRAEIEAAVGVTLAWGLGDNHSLCHGTLGNLEFLFQAAETLSRPDILSSANRIKLSMLESAASEGWECGIPLSIEAPGLMTGLAGIGYGLLRLAEPLRVPSVLLLSAAFHQHDPKEDSVCRVPSHRLV
ncbi:MAG: type 2 lanthipeptide synthetase LanM family protein [Pyrinomonadaceae bacterium]